MAASAPKASGRVGRRITTNKNKLVKLERDVESLQRAVGNLQEIMTDLRLRVRMLEREEVGTA